MTLTKKQTQILEKFADDFGVNFKKSYSGRGMYGKTCIGFVGDVNLFTLGFSLAQYLLDNEDEDAPQYLSETFAFERANTDSMGYDTIVYFHGIVCEDEDEDEEDDEY